MRVRLIGAALVAVLLTTIGCGPRHTESDAAATDPVPLSVVRHGNEFTLTGDVTDPAAKRDLVDAVVSSADDVTVVDRLTVTPNAATPDLSVAAPVFETASVIGDFSLRADGDTVTLAGTAATAAEAAAVADAAEHAWPRSHVVNVLVITPPR